MEQMENMRSYESYEQRNVVQWYWWGVTNWMKLLDTLGTTGRKFFFFKVARNGSVFTAGSRILASFRVIGSDGYVKNISEQWLWFVVMKQDHVAPGPFSSCTMLYLAWHHFAAQVSCSDAGLGLAGEGVGGARGFQCVELRQVHNEIHVCPWRWVSICTFLCPNSWLRWWPLSWTGWSYATSFIMPQCVETCGDKPESARRDILKLLIKTNLNSFDRSCSNMFPKKRHIERMQTYPAHRSWQQHFFAQDLQKPSEPGLNGCVKCSGFHCQHLYIHLMWCNVMWCDVCHHMPHFACVYVMLCFSWMWGPEASRPCRPSASQIFLMPEDPQAHQLETLSYSNSYSYMLFCLNCPGPFGVLKRNQRIQSDSNLQTHTVELSRFIAFIYTHIYIYI